MEKRRFVVVERGSIKDVFPVEEGAERPFIDSIIGFLHIKTAPDGETIAIYAPSAWSRAYEQLEP